MPVRSWSDSSAAMPRGAREGSGLGRDRTSFAAAQQGSFHVEIDGDLFKAVKASARIIKAEGTGRISTMVKDMVSIIVPVYNVEGYIDRCLQSMAAQSMYALRKSSW